MRNSTRLVSLVFGLLLSSATTGARAQSSDYDQRINSALNAFESGRWAEARSDFRRAHELDPTARTLRTIGMCSFNLGDYVDAVQSLEAALTDSRKPLTAEQRTQVSDLIERARTKLGRFRLHLSPTTATLLVDAGPPRLTASGELLLEPGRHDLSISNQGFATQQRKVNVEAGDRSTLEFTLEASTVAGPVEKLPMYTATLVPENGAEPASASPGVEQAPSPTPQPSAASGGGSTQRTLGYASLIVGAAGVVTFAITGGIALGKKSDLDSSCPNHTCSPAHYDEVDSYDTLRGVSTVSLIAGGALLSLGAILLLTSGDGASGEHARTLEPQLGLGYAGLRGSL